MHITVAFGIFTICQGGTNAKCRIMASSWLLLLWASSLMCRNSQVIKFQDGQARLIYLTFSMNSGHIYDKAKAYRLIGETGESLICHSASSWALCGPNIGLIQGKKILQHWYFVFNVWMPLFPNHAVFLWHCSKRLPFEHLVGFCKNFTNSVVLF